MRIRRMHTAAKFLALTTIACLLGGCVFIDSARFKETRSLVAVHEPGSAIVLETANGGVIIRRADVDEVEITARIKARTQERLDATEIYAREETDGLHIGVQWPGEHRQNNEGCSFEVLAPDAAGVHVRTGNGGVTVEGLAGLADLHTSNGRVTVHDHDGDVDASTSNGAIIAEDITGAVHADTSNGAVRIVLADGSPGPVTASTSNGSINATFTDSFSGEISGATSNGGVYFDKGDSLYGRGNVRLISTSRHSLRLALGDPDHAAAPSTLRTSNGSIHIRIRREASASAEKGRS